MYNVTIGASNNDGGPAFAVKSVHFKTKRKSYRFLNACFEKKKRNIRSPTCIIACCSPTVLKSTIRDILFGGNVVDDLLFKVLPIVCWVLCLSLLWYA